MPFDRRSYVVLDLPDPVARAVTAIREQFSPLRALYPPEITVAGSGGVGPIAADEEESSVFERLREVAAATAPISAGFAGVTRFDGTSLYYFAVADRRPFDALHQRIAASGIRFGDSPFPYTPHCTISGVELDDEQRRAITALQVDDGFVLDTISIYSEPVPIERHFQVRLTG